MSGCMVSAANMSGCIVCAASAAHMARCVVIGATPHGTHVPGFFATAARMADTIISTTAASMAHPVVCASTA